jgi:hypothetical protein
MDSLYISQNVHNDAMEELTKERINQRRITKRKPDDVRSYQHNGHFLRFETPSIN